MEAPTPHILVVDDDRDALRLIERHLTKAGYPVRGVASAAEALTVLHNEGPEILIADWMMPEISGLELARMTRSSESIGFVYIIILTAHTGTSRLVEAFDAGVDDFLSKPLNKQELLARLNAANRILTLEHDLDQERRAVHKTNAELAVVNAKLERMATTDELTQLANRREAMRRLNEFWARGSRDHAPLASIMLDIDHFKRCNDTYGHDAGDTVLRETANALRQNARAGDTVCRLGGEEFLVLCPGATAEMAAIGAERLRAAVESNLVRHDDVELSVTVSAGVGAREASMPSPDDLLKAADEALYAAKRGGRNRVCVADACST